MKLSKYFWIITGSVCLVLTLFLVGGIANNKGQKSKVVQKKMDGGGVVVNYSSNVDGLSITGANPTSQMIGMKSSEEGSYFDFSVDVNLVDAHSVTYEISLMKDSANSTISDDDIRIYLEKEKDGTYTKVFGPLKFTPAEDKTDIGTEEGNMVLVNAKKVKSGTDRYRLRMWLSDSSLMQNGSYSVKVLVNGVAK